MSFLLFIAGAAAGLAVSSYLWRTRLYRIDARFKARQCALEELLQVIEERRQCLEILEACREVRPSNVHLSKN